MHASVSVLKCGVLGTKSTPMSEFVVNVCCSCVIHKYACTTINWFMCVWNEFVCGCMEWHGMEIAQYGFNW